MASEHRETMEQPQLRWKDAAAPRAKPIPLQKWEEHKDELCELYPKMTLKDLMILMKVRHQFTASPRQYSFQMERWGIQKYNKSASRNSTSNPADSPPVKLDVQTAKEETADYVPRKGSRKREAGTRPEVPPKKRQKLSDFMDSKAVDGLVVQFEKMSPSCEDLTAAKISSTPLPAKDNPFVERGPRPNSPWSVRSTDATDDQASTCSSSDGGDDISMADDLELQQPDSADEFLAFDLDEFNRLKAAADFAFVVQFRADSFNLYVILLQRLKTLEDAPMFLQNASQFVKRMTSLAIVGCARSATTNSQLQISINQLEQQLSQRPVYAQNFPESFLFRSLLEQCYRQHGMKFEADIQQQLASQSSCVQDKTLLQQRGQAMSLLEYFYLDHALSRGQFIASHNLKEELITCKPGLFEYKNGRMNSSSIRECLEWCLWKLSNRGLCPTHWLPDNPSTRTNLLGLMSDLWPSWRDKMVNDFSSRDLACAGLTEKDFGISPTEFLATICETILKEAPLIPPIELASIGGPLAPLPNDWQWTILRAVSGIKSLLKRSDWTLASVFVKAYSELNSECYVKDVAGNYNSHQDLKCFLKQKANGIELPDLPVLSQLDLDANARSTNGASYSETNLTGLFTTLNPSVRSDTILSLRALKDRIEIGAGGYVDGFDMTLPSSMMRNAPSAISFNLFTQSLMRGDSQSLLGGTSSTNISFSALETLASVSTCVRDRIEEVEYKRLGMKQLV